MGQDPTSLCDVKNTKLTAHLVNCATKTDIFDFKANKEQQSPVKTQQTFGDICRQVILKLFFKLTLFYQLT